MVEQFEGHELEQSESGEFTVVSFEADAEDFENAESDDVLAVERELESELAELDAEESVMVLEEVDVALVLPVWEPTGDAQVDSALEQLASLDELSVHDHAEVLTSVHSSLHQRLTDISA